jgi:hypothetical protein
MAGAPFQTLDDFALLAPVNRKEFSKGQQIIHPLLEERAGVRTNDLTDCFCSHSAKNPALLALALILTFSPWEKEQHSNHSFYANDCPEDTETIARKASTFEEMRDLVANPCPGKDDTFRAIESHLETYSGNCGHFDPLQPVGSAKQIH